MQIGGGVGTRLIFSTVADLVMRVGLFAALGASMELRAQALTENDDADPARALLEEGRARTGAAQLLSANAAGSRSSNSLGHVWPGWVSRVKGKLVGTYGSRGGGAHSSIPPG